MLGWMQAYKGAGAKVSCCGGGQGKFYFENLNLGVLFLSSNLYAWERSTTGGGVKLGVCSNTGIVFPSVRCGIRDASDLAASTEFRS